MVRVGRSRAAEHLQRLRPRGDDRRWLLDHRLRHARRRRLGPSVRATADPNLRHPPRFLEAHRPHQSPAHRRVHVDPRGSRAGLAPERALPQLHLPLVRGPLGLRARDQKAPGVLGPRSRTSVPHPPSLTLTNEIPHEGHPPRSRCAHGRLWIRLWRRSRAARAYTAPRSRRRRVPERDAAPAQHGRR